MTDDEKKHAADIVLAYRKQWRTWNTYAMISLAAKVTFTFAAGLCAIIAAVVADDKTSVRYFGVGAAGATLASAVVDRFGTPRAWRDAWRALGTAIDKYAIGRISIAQLVDCHSHAEDMITIMVTEPPDQVAGGDAAPTSGPTRETPVGRAP